jgi:hypothetical protein
MYQPRTYRHWSKNKRLVSFGVVLKETDLLIRASVNLENEALDLVKRYRDIIEKYIYEDPEFLISLKPLIIKDDAPNIIRDMADAAAITGTGPMAGIAGAIAEYVGRGLLPFSTEIIVENGGDIYLKTLKKRTIGVYAGKSPLTGKIGLEIAGGDTPVGICTSSGTVGHSFSYGKSDAVIVLSESAILADTAATTIGNLVREQVDIGRAIDKAKSIPGLKGLVIILGTNVGAWGNIKLCSLSETQ